MSAEGEDGVEAVIAENGVEDNWKEADELSEWLGMYVDRSDLKVIVIDGSFWFVVADWVDAGLSDKGDEALKSGPEGRTDGWAKGIGVPISEAMGGKITERESMIQRIDLIEDVLSEVREGEVHLSVVRGIRGDRYGVRSVGHDKKAKGKTKEAKEAKEGSEDEEVMFEIIN